MHNDDMVKCITDSCIIYTVELYIKLPKQQLENCKVVQK